MRGLHVSLFFLKPLQLCLLALASMVFHAPFVAAQKVVLTAQHNADGTPNSEFTSNTWQIDGIKGSFVYVLFQHNQLITEEKLYLFVDKKVGSSFEEYDTKKIFIRNRRTWSVVKYTFSQAGEYQVAIADSEKNVLASTIVCVTYKTKVYFSNQIDKNGLPINHQREFKLHQNSLIVYVFVKDTKPFASNALRVSIACRTNENDYKTYVEEIFPIDATWRFSFFKQSFSQKGTYRVIISKDNNKLLAVGFFKII